MSTLVVGIIIGLVGGGLVTGLLFWKMMPSMMLKVKPSNRSFEETVAQIESKALAKGWQVPKIYDLQNSLHEAGYNQFGRLKIVSMCQPDHAHKILSIEDNKKIAAMMPCRVGVFEGADGKTYISQMNIGLMSKMFGGTIEEVMGKVAEEEHEMMSALVTG